MCSSDLWSSESAVTVVLASENYPQNVKIDLPIVGISEIAQTSIFHAGTKKADGILKSNGGRVLSVTGLGKDLSDARNNAYEVISKIKLEGSFYRSDIALKASQGAIKV